MNVIIIAVAAFVGALVAATLGWTDSGELFNPRKFGASAIRALFAAVAFAVAYTYADTITVLDVCIAFVAGSGIDVLGNRISGSIKAGLKQQRW